MHVACPYLDPCVALCLSISCGVLQVMERCEVACILDNSCNPHPPMFVGTNSFPSSIQLNNGMEALDKDLDGVHMDAGGVPWSLMVLIELRGRADGIETALCVQNKWVLVIFSCLDCSCLV